MGYNIALNGTEEEDERRRWNDASYFTELKLCRDVMEKDDGIIKLRGKVSVPW